MRGVVSPRRMEVSDAMWEAAGEKFYRELPVDCGMADEKYSLIKNVLQTWDDLTAGDRREQSGGNHIFWQKRYRVVNDRLCYNVPDLAETGGEEDALEVKQVSCCEVMFDDIKSVHTASVCHSLLPSCLAHTSPPEPVCLPLFAENHNKDNALFKACQQKFGNSIPRRACQLFVKCCPVCIGQVNTKKKKVAGFQPIITKGFGKRAQARAVCKYGAQ